MGVVIHLTKLYDSATIICAKKKVYITFIPETAPVPNVPEADVFGTGIFH
jgi:hypothetical protein